MSLWKRFLNFIYVQEEVPVAKPVVSTVRPCIRRIGEVQDAWHKINDSIPLCRDVKVMKEYFDMKYQIGDWLFAAMLASVDGSDDSVNTLLDAVEREAKRFQEMFSVKEPENALG